MMATSMQSTIIRTKPATTHLAIYMYFANPTRPYSVALHLSQTNLRPHTTCTTNHPAKMKEQHMASSSSSSSSPLQSANDPNNYQETAEEDDDVHAVEQRRQMLISILAKAMEIWSPPLSSSSSSNAAFAPVTSPSRLGRGDLTHPQHTPLPPAAAVVENQRRRRGDVAEFRSFLAEFRSFLAAASRHSQRLQDVQRSQLERRGVSAIVGIRLSNDDEGDERNDEGVDDEQEHDEQE